jgi:hypothetical protein
LRRRTRAWAVFLVPLDCGSERPKGYKHCSINRRCTVEERASNLLLDASRGELGGCVEEWLELDGGSIVWFEPGMR